MTCFDLKKQDTAIYVCGVIIKFNWYLDAFCNLIYIFIVAFSSGTERLSWVSFLNCSMNTNVKTVCGLERVSQQLVHTTLRSPRTSIAATRVSSPS